MKPGIQAKLIAVALAIGIAMSGLISGYAIYMQEAEVAEDLENRGQALATLLAETLVGPIYTLRIDEASRMLAAVLHDPEIVAAYAIGPDGLSVSSGREGEDELQIENGLLELSPVIESIRKEPRMHVQAVGDLLFVTAPVQTVDGTLVGFVHLRLTMERAMRDARKMRLAMVLIAALVLALGSLLAVVLARRFSAQIREILDGAKKIGQGLTDIEVPVRSGDEIGQLAAGINHMSRELDRHRNHLEELVHARTAELADAMSAAEAANLAKSRFLATMSHEIRTPMNGILGMAQLMMMHGLEENERLDYARVILNSGQTLLTLLNDILDLSKIEAGKIELQTTVFQPEQLIHETAALFAEAVRSKGLRLETAWHGAMETRYRADSIRLRQMLSNLVGNAVKFTAQGFVRIEGGEIEAASGERLLKFSVTDSGIGIPADKQELLFKPFSQVDASNTRQYGGTGLGLSIVRSLARLMHGDAGMESESGKGSCFWFSVRARRIEEGDESRQSERHMEAPAIPSPTEALVLVAEDNVTNRKVIESMLKKRGLRFESVENGQEAVERIAAGVLPDLVLMDCQMPVLDGFEATRQIRQWEQRTARPRLPIIALTASAYEHDRQRCLEAGMDDFLVKPVNLEVLEAVVAKWSKIGGT